MLESSKGPSLFLFYLKTSPNRLYKVLFYSALVQRDVIYSLFFLLAIDFVVYITEDFQHLLGSVSHLGVFFSYVLLGLSLAAPIGPINAAQLDRGIKNGFLHAWLIGIGSVVADFIYMLIVYFGIVNFIDTPFVKTFLWSFGFFVLIYTGIESLLSSKEVVMYTRKKQKASYSKTFFTGFFMALSNPLTILFWLGIFGSVLAETASTYDQKHLIIYSGAIFLGITVWDVCMAALSSSFRRFLTNKLLIVISALSSISLIGFGLYFGWQAIQLLLNH